ncbi:MAG: glycosyltransferase [Paracoccus sp. (in: a-proteobacteria)]|nr:glycosyltransferase [Paracoccus sp. (in: a-proteobacteria)]
MSISFIITTYNISPYIQRCLHSVAEVARPGDEVIVVDDGSDDGTLEAVQQFAGNGGFAPDVTFRPVYLGTNTMGGVGIGANIGMAEATRETVFFVDGDDWIDPAGFARARAHWALHPTDILFTNYLEFDQAAGLTKPPADAQRWAAIDNNLPLEIRRAQGIGLIAVPWRKFYRRNFLNVNRLRFPEGDFFFEDNPFHWAVCLKADSIGFVNAVTCFHRINRPGQTMASTGTELAAFFTHFGTIMDGLPVDDIPNRLGACRWLLNNMTWHMARLSQPARHRYAVAASHALRRVPDTMWQQLADEESENPIFPIADRLRKGDVDGQILDWQNRALARCLTSLEDRIRTLEEENNRLSTFLRGISAASAFESIQRRRAGTEL